MNHAMKHLNHENMGLKKVDFEAELQMIADQIRLIEQKLTIKVDKEIYKAYEQQHHLINQCKFDLKL